MDMRKRAQELRKNMTLEERILWYQYLKEYGGFYYHKAPVGSKGSTEILISSCQLKDGVTAPTGYKLNVEILTQTIQALGETDGDATANPQVEPIPAVTDAWKVFVDQNGYLTPTPPTT